MNAKIAIALTAGFGGISPSLLKLALGLTGDSNHVPVVNFGYIVGLLIYAAMGGAIALIWRERIPRRAFYLGLGLPSLLHVVLSPPVPYAGASGGSSSREQRGEFYVLTPPAYAMQVPQAAPELEVRCEGLSYQMGRNLGLALDDVLQGTELIFVSQDGKTICKKPLPPSDENGRVNFPIPDYMAEFVLRSGSLESAGVQLNQDRGSMTRYAVDIDSNFWGGFLKALGVESAKPYEFEVKRLPG